MVLPSPQDLIQQLNDARERTCALILDLNDEQLMGPCLPTINPLRWEIGHIAYFYEYWVLRQHYKEKPLINGIDDLFDSIHIPHKSRWDLTLPTLQDTLQYMQDVKNRVVVHLENGNKDHRRDYLVQYSIFHEDMHCEAFTYTRQTLQYPTPAIDKVLVDESYDQLTGDAQIPAGKFQLGGSQSSAFIFDNEKWAHEINVEPFKISRVAVSNKDYIKFINDEGYLRAELWDEQGWVWRSKLNVQHPIYWRRAHNRSGWELRWFDNWHELQDDTALVNVNWYEANAYCQWAQRRLPSELEWEVAAAASLTDDRKSLTSIKHNFPWGDEPFQANHATINGLTLGPVSVHANPEGDSAIGCRQMLGNVWEWTSTTFNPYPGFTPDMYQDYSQPLFGKTKVLRGGCWATRSRLLRNTLRNYYGPERNDVFAGFRTCALD